MRVALNYAMASGSGFVRLADLLAAKAWQDYSTQTVRAVFGGLGRNETGRKILASLRSHPGTASSRSQIHAVLGRNRTGAEISAAIEELTTAGLAYEWKAESTGGAPPFLLVATMPTEGATSYVPGVARRRLAS